MKYKARITIISIFLVIAICSMVFGIFGVTKTAKDKHNMGHSYFELAKYAADVNTAVEMLDRYAEEVKKNGMDTGTCGVYYKTPANDMANRYDRLILGTEFLRELSEKYEKSERLNTVDFTGIMILTNAADGDSYSMKKFISNLPVGMGSYMTANSMLYRMMGFWGIFFLILGACGTIGLSIALGCTVEDKKRGW